MLLLVIRGVSLNETASGHFTLCGLSGIVAAAALARLKLFGLAYIFFMCGALVILLRL